MSRKSESSVHCGIVLAGGDGKRLQGFVRRLRGKDLPKQYVNFIGTRSMLEHTFSRAQKVVFPDHLFTVVNREHLKHHEVWEQLSTRPKGTVVFQPRNKETGPGILLPLIHLYKKYPQAIVVTFPSDHFVLEENLFMNHVDLAYQIVGRDPSVMVLLGMEPLRLEPDYGYILPGNGAVGSLRNGLRPVLRFFEKPDRQTANDLFHKGGLWNTMVMAFKAERLLGLAQKVAPGLWRCFQRIWSSIGTPHEKDVVEDVYHKIEPLNFSKEILETISVRYSSCLKVLPVQGVYWCDWGSEHRINSAIEHIKQWRGLSAVQTA